MTNQTSIGPMKSTEWKVKETKFNAGIKKISSETKKIYKNLKRKIEKA